ncbi:MAG: hypothetical protein ACOC56_00750 [Atribacterota bacterium]
MKNFLKNRTQHKPSAIKLNLYCDEIKKSTIEDRFIGREEWIYIGVLIVPIIYEKSLLANLLNRRCGDPKKTKIWGECDPQCEYHTKNNKSVHYTELDSYDKYYIAKRWLQFLWNY